MVNLKVAIIGAGPAGLVALKTVLEDENRYVVTAYEAKEDIGGVWDPREIYDALTTNLPHPLMAFPDYPFPESTPLFPGPQAVRQYLHDYADHFRLRPHIRLSSRVQDASWDVDRRCWVLTVEHRSPSTDSEGGGGEVYKTEADLLLVCNGHYNLPRMPSNAPPSSSPLFSHSQDYRRPLSGYGSRVLVVGGGPSGQDIVADLVSCPSIRQVFHSTSSPPSPGPSTTTSDKVINKPRTISYSTTAEEGGTLKLTAHFADGSTEEGISHCIFATGYEMSFPFLSSFIKPSFPPLPSPSADDVSRLISVGVLYNTSYSVFPLYKHLFPFPLSELNTPFPSPSSSPPCSSSPTHPSTPAPPPTSIAFLSLLYRVAPLPVSASQARLALAAFTHPEAIDWNTATQEVLNRWECLSSAHPTPNPSPASDPGSTNKTRIKDVLKEWHRFEPMDQFDYRDAVDELAEKIASPTRTLPTVEEKKKKFVNRVRPFERPLYALKDLLRRTWRYLEQSGHAGEWVAGVGAFHDKESGRERSLEEIDQDWTELMWKVVDFGRKREGLDA